MKTYRKAMLVFTIVTALAGGIGCGGGGGGGGANNVPVTGVSLDKTTATVAEGSTEQLVATVTPSTATNKAVTWTSGNTAVATVSAGGIVTGKTAGSATITAISADNSSAKADCSVTVSGTTPYVPVTGVTLDKTTLTVVAGTTEQLVATVSPATATNKAVTWTSSDTAIATVSAGGIVTAKGGGCVTITATSVDNTSRKAVCSTSVTAYIAASGVIINKSATTIGKGDAEQLAATVSPVTVTNRAVTWTSSNTDIATVNANGLVTASAANTGSATITATSVDNVSVKAECAVTVSAGAVLNKADIACIGVSGGEIQPPFVSTTTEYLDAPVPYTQTSVNITPLVSDDGSTVKVNGSTVAPGNSYDITNLPVGSTTVTIEVTAPDGTTTKTYTVYVYRAVPVYKTGAGAIAGYTLDPREDGAVLRGVAWPDPRFTDNGDETITDNMTGLVWLKDANKYYTDNPTDPNGGKRPWADAITYCAGTFAGKSDWRLPNICELRSLANYGDKTGTSWLNGQGFLNVQNSYYWSSTTIAPATINAWQITSLGCPWYGFMDKTGNSFIWPVRADPLGLPVTGQTMVYTAGDDGTYQKGTLMPSVRFRDNGDGTIIDNMTGLVWLKDANAAGSKNWNDAFAYIDTLNNDPAHNLGYADWRLPTLNELETLVNYAESSLASWLNGKGFANVQGSDYWSSTTSVYYNNKVWSLDMVNTYLNAPDKTYARYLLIVREAR